MLYYDRIDISKGIDVNKTSASKECDICYYRCSLNYSFKLHPNVCSRCYNLPMMSINFSDSAILNIKGSDYCCIISSMNKNGAINLMQNPIWPKKAEHYKIELRYKI